MPHLSFIPPSRYPPVHGTWLLSGLLIISPAMNVNFSQIALFAVATCIAARNSMSTTFLRRIR